MEIEWKPYDKIPYQIESSAKAASTSWVVTEKIHGAHMAVVCNSSLDVSFAKRSRLLAHDESFFQYQRISENLSESVKKLWVEIVANVRESPAPTGPGSLDIESGQSGNQRDFGLTLVSVHGELFGGYYPHPSLVAHSATGLKPVQTGLWYSPNLHFVVYDIAVYHRDTMHWLPYEDTLRLADSAGFLVLKPLFVGSQAQAMSFSTRFSSFLPEQLGLPSLNDTVAITGSGAKRKGKTSKQPEAIINLAEGIVVRPLSSDERTLVKIKNAEFAEIGDEVDFDSMGRTDIGFILARINKNRIAAARSKTGGADDVEDGQVIDAVVDDVVTEICSEGNASLLARVAALTPEESIAIRDYTQSLL